MKKFSFLLSLTNRTNDYQKAQGAAAQEAATRLGVSLRIVYAENDPLTQSQQLLENIQSSLTRPDAIVFQPAGTALAQVAQAAAAAGIGWAVLNKEADYITKLQHRYNVPIFSITSDHAEIGRLQGRQFGALLPAGGTILYIQGTSASAAAELRTQGMHQTKPDNIETRTIRGNWTEEGAYHAVTSWLRLSTSRDLPLLLVGSQNDAMAMGARRAFHEHATGKERERRLNMPFTGCDGGFETGMEWVRKGWLAATVVRHPNAGRAIESMVDSLLHGTQQPACTMDTAKSYPSIEELSSRTSDRTVTFGSTQFATALART